MRGTVYAVIMAMTAFVVLSCGKDETASQPSADSREPSATMRISEVHCLFHDITHEYDSYARANLVGSDTAVQDYVCERWRWDADTLRAIDYYAADGSLRYTVAFGYDSRHRVSYRRSDEDGAYTRFVYGGDRLDSIVTQRDKDFIWHCVFHFASPDDLYPVGATTASFDNGALSSVTDYDLTFQDGNLMSYAFRSYGTLTRHDYTYDSHPNPYLRAGRSLSYLYLSRNNAVADDYHYEGDGNVSDEHTDYSYTYANGAIATLDLRKESVVGRYVNQYIYHYEYRYLTD